MRPRGPGRPVSDYNAPHYWLDYSGGFVRRGLPGALLRAGLGRPPAYDDVTRAGLALSGSAAVALVPVVVRACRPVRSPGGAAAAGVLLLSPLTVDLLLRDSGRYDAVGVAALALVTATGVLRPPPTAGTVLLAGVVAVATASEEFLLAVLALPAVVAARAVGAGRLAVGVLAPAAVVAAASVVLPAPEGAIARARDAARAAGVPPAGPMGDALGALERGLVENLAFFRLFEPRAVVGSVLLWAGLYGLTATLVGRLLGPPPGHRRLAAVHGGVGAALSAMGTDSRRWWGLALAGLVSTLAVLPGERRPAPVRGRDLAGAAALTAVGLAVRRLPVHPWGPMREADLPAT